jgi:hypothetical protein
MKRDLELVRKILLQLEEGGEETGPSGWSSMGEQGYDLPAIHYHVRLLHDAGLIEADELVPGQWWPERMTWAGHEFLDAARNDEIWNEVRDRVEQGVGSAPFSIFHELLIRRNRERLEGEPEGGSSTRPPSGTMEKLPRI